MCRNNGGQFLLIWLLKILNSIVDEIIPDSFKCGSITPVYKGGGKDPLDKNSFRDIVPVLAKILEILILERMSTLYFCRLVFPHINQTAYRWNVDCIDAIFATLEAIANYVWEGSTVYMCYMTYNNFVEFPVLLIISSQLVSMVRPEELSRIGMRVVPVV